MSLPYHLNVNDKNFFDSRNIATNPDFIYLNSIKETNGINENSIFSTFNDSDTCQPL